MKFYYTLIILTLYCLFSSVNLNAQNIIKGKILNATSKQLLEEVTIYEWETNSSSLTDAYGRFEIETNANTISADISSVGFKKQRVALTADKINIIELLPAQTSLKEIILTSSVTASKFSNISKIDISLKPVKSSQELLRLAPGLFIAQHAGGGKAEQIFLRGFDADHGTDVSVNVDGMPVNMVSHAHGQGYADAHFIIPETIKNLDFGAGPYYAGYGNFTTAGYINFSTFDKIDKSRFQLEAGRYNSYRSLLILDLIKQHKEKQSAYIAADFNYSDGPTENKQRFKRLNIFGKYDAAITAKTQLSASIYAFKSEWDASGQIPERAVSAGLISRFGSLDPSEGGNTERYNANIILNTQLKNNLQWENQFYYSRYAFNLYSNFTFFAKDSIHGDGIQQKEDRNLFGAKTSFIYKNQMQQWKVKTAYTTGLRYDATNNSQLNKQVKRTNLGSLKNGNIKETNIYAFVQKQFSNRKWSFDAAMRLDYFNAAYYNNLSTTQLPSRSASILSPKLNIQYTASRNVQLYVKTGRGFHSNDSRVVVATAGKEILPAAYGADLGVLLKPTTNLFINMAAWYLKLNQEFVYVGDEGIVEPSGATTRKGLDLDIRYQFKRHFYANMNINYTHARALNAKKGENYIPLAPDFTSTGGLYYKAIDGWNGGLSYRFIKNRAANEDYSITAKGYFIMDASINYTKQKYELGLSVENLTNVKWNEAQFATLTKLQNEQRPVNEIHFTAGTPFFAKAKLVLFF